MHSWYDDLPWPYWDELYQAERYIRDYTYKWSGCRLSSKEKYGTIRYEALFPPFSSYRFGPYIKVPYFKRTIKIGEEEIKCAIFLWIWNQSYIHNLWVMLGKLALRKAIKNSYKLFPNVKKEVTADAKWFLE